jgi:hypothetical protein
MEVYMKAMCICGRRVGMKEVYAYLNEEGGIQWVCAHCREKRPELSLSCVGVVRAVRALFDRSANPRTLGLIDWIDSCVDQTLDRILPDAIEAER